MKLDPDTSPVVSDAEDPPIDADWVLLEVLRRDARTPVEDLAALTGQGPETVEARIRELLSEGAIERIQVTFDLRRLGLSFQALAEVRCGGDEAKWRDRLSQDTWTIDTTLHPSYPGHILALLATPSPRELVETTERWRRDWGLETPELFLIAPLHPDDDER